MHFGDTYSEKLAVLRKLMALSSSHQFFPSLAVSQMSPRQIPNFVFTIHVSKVFVVSFGWIRDLSITVH